MKFLARGVYTCKLWGIHPNDSTFLLPDRAFANVNNLAGAELRQVATICEVLEIDPKAGCTFLLHPHGLERRSTTQANP